MRRVRLPLAALLALGLCGCISAPTYAPAPARQAAAGIPGIYHRVEKGQTLWRISKLYGVDVDELARLNNITEAANIEIGQTIFIPRQNNNRVFEPRVNTSLEDDFAWPLRGRVISGFGQRTNNVINKGIKIAPYGDDTVAASRSGKVVFCANDFNGYGKTIIIDHGDGFSSVYARNSQVLVSLGQRVQKGAAIAKAGSAGRDRTRYLYFQIRKGHIAKNPSFYLNR